MAGDHEGVCGGPGGEGYKFVIKQNTNLALKSLMKNKKKQKKRKIAAVIANERVTFLGCVRVFDGSWACVNVTARKYFRVNVTARKYFRSLVC